MGSRHFSSRFRPRAIFRRDGELLSAERVLFTPYDLFFRHRERVACYGAKTAGDEVWDTKKIGIVNLFVGVGIIAEL